MNTNTAIEIMVDALDNGEIEDNKLAHAAELIVSQYRVAALREANKDATIAAQAEQIAALKHLLFLATAPLERLESGNVGTQTEQLASDALRLIRDTLAATEPRPE